MINRKNNKIVEIWSNRAMIFIVAFTLLFAVGCREDELSYAEFVEIDGEGWSYNDIKCYDIQPVDSTDLIIEENFYDVILTLRHSSAYEYENIWLETTINPSSMNRIDTLELRLVDKMGKWLGKGYGGIYEISDTLYRNVAFKTLQQIKIRQIMTDSLLKNVNSIGIIVIKPKK